MAEKQYVDELVVKAKSYDIRDTEAQERLDALETKVNQLPEPMVFKGTIGPDGTIENLPTSSSTNIGHVYKVYADGTYAGQKAKSGDVFISTGSEWAYIPSADETDAKTVNGISFSVVD